MKPKIIIRADGDAAIGMGHVVRCMALADMLKADFQIMFAIQRPPDHVIKKIHSVTETIFHLPLEKDPAKDAENLCSFLDPSDIVVLDGYNFRTEYQQTIKNKGCKLVVIDDLHAWHHVADVIINHAASVNQKDYSAEGYTEFCFGLPYALLRKPFLASGPAAERKKIEKTFISMGAADINNLTHKFCEALSGVPGIKEIHLMLGAANPHIKDIDGLAESNCQVNIIKHIDISAESLASLLRECDVAVCPASSISMESCAIGIGLLCGYTADNQQGILNGLIENNAALSMGDMNSISITAIRQKFESITPEIVSHMLENQRKMIDGKSPERLLTVFRNIKKEKLHFRLANESDVDFYYIWANDPLVRANSYNHAEIRYEDHVKWFNSKLASGTCFFYLFLTEDNKPVGQVRIDAGGSETVLGISVDNAYRGKGLGTDMLIASTNDFLKKNPSATIVAYIKTENVPSYNSFKKAGFNGDEVVTEQGAKSHKLYKKAE